jgi:hypothetical protein
MNTAAVFKQPEFSNGFKKMEDVNGGCKWVVLDRGALPVLAAIQ